MTPYSDWLSANSTRVAKSSQGAPTVQTSGLDDLISDLSLALSLEEEATLAVRMSEIGSEISASQESYYQRKLERSIDELQKRLVNTVSRAIEPLLSETLLKKCIADFVSVLGGYVKSASAQTVIVSTPAEMRETLEANLAGSGIEAEIVVGEFSEISTEIASTEIVTNLAEWAERLRKAAA